MRQFLFGFLLLTWANSNAQDPLFSQLLSNPVYLNPAFVGYNGCPTVQTAYRNQWPKISGNFQTVNASYDQLIGKRHGIGVNYQFDMAGNTIESHSISVIYAPAFRLFKQQVVISPAYEISWRYRKLHQDNLTFGDMIDPRYGTVYSQPQNLSNTERHYADFSTGFLLTWRGLVAGFAAHHISQPDEGFAGFSKLPVKLAGHVNYQFDITEKVKISPAFIYHKQQDFRSILPSLSAEVYGARIGVAYRTSLTNSDAVIFMLGYRGYGVRVGYSYDLTVSSLTNNTGGSHEVSLAYIFSCNKSERRKGVPLINF